MYYSVANSTKASAKEIYRAAVGLNKLDPKNKESTVKLLELMIDPRKNPEPSDLAAAATMFNSLNYPEKAVELFLRSANGLNFHTK